MLATIWLVDRRLDVDHLVEDFVVLVLHLIGFHFFRWPQDCVSHLIQIDKFT